MLYVIQHKAMGDTYVYKRESWDDDLIREKANGQSRQWRCLCKDCTIKVYILSRYIGGPRRDTIMITIDNDMRETFQWCHKSWRYRNILTMAFLSRLLYNIHSVRTSIYIVGWPSLRPFLSAVARVCYISKSNDISDLKPNCCGI